MLKKLFKKNRTFYFFYSFIISIVFFICYQETRNVNNDIHSNNNEQYNDVENSIDNNI